MIEARGLYKSFGKKTAVKDLSLSVKSGVAALLGANGAGKSTTIRMLCGFYPPDKGEIFIDKIPMHIESVEAKKRIGYLPESAPSYTDLTIKEFLSFIEKIKRSDDNSGYTLKDVLEVCFLEEVQKQKIGTLSKGFQHRVCLAQSLLGNPSVLVMDEPTDGLDPNQKFQIRKLISELASSKAILMTTHILEEVDAVCDYVYLMGQGRLLAEGTTDEIKNLAKAETMHIHAVCLTPSENLDLDAMGKAFAPHEIETQDLGEKIEISLLVKKHTSSLEEIASELAFYLVSHKMKLVSLKTSKMQLNDFFREFAQ